MARKRTNRRYCVVVKSRPAEAEDRPGLCETRFWLLAFSVALVSILTRTFDFSLWPLSYRGLYITRPYYGLHSWACANHAWAARSHLKYGLGYTKGYHTPAVGYPPPANPQRYVSHPPLKTLIALFNTEKHVPFDELRAGSERSRMDLGVEEFSAWAYNCRDQRLCQCL